ARLLKQARKNLVGLSVHLTEHPYLTRLLAVVRDELLRRGYEPILVEPSHFEPTRSNSPFPSVEMLAGIFSFGDEFQAQHLLPLRHRVPIVALHPIKSTDIDLVYTDIALGTEMMVDHLVDLGH